MTIDLSRVEKFDITIGQDVLDDLKRRLDDTRWPTLQVAAEESSIYGIDQATLARLVERWRGGFDWRAAETELNKYNHYRATVQGQTIHFMHRPSKRSDAIPVIATHGWPWTFWHWSKVVDELSDPTGADADGVPAFDLVIPSYPGFGFSTPLHDPTLTFWRVADLWQELMVDVLGYETYGAVGGDFGAMVTAQMGHKYADSLVAIHVSTPTPLDIFHGERWWDITEGRISPEGASDIERDGLQRYMKKFVAHIAVHMLDPQTLTYGLSDSPVGMLAWIVRRYQLWVDHDNDLESVFSTDDLLTIATIFWATNSIGSSIRTYANTAHYRWQPSHDRVPAIEAPAGITFLGFENPPGVTAQQRADAYRSAASKRSPSDRSARWYNLVNVKAHEHGGHFAPWENPEGWIVDMRETFALAQKAKSNG